MIAYKTFLSFFIFLLLTGAAFADQVLVSDEPPPDGSAVLVGDNTPANSSDDAKSLQNKPEGDSDNDVDDIPDDIGLITNTENNDGHDQVVQ